MTRELSQIRLELLYHRTAQEYLRKLPLKHFMEATPQATQREITLASLGLVKAQRSDVHLFNELLVQYPVPRRKKPKGVVPDNMVVLHSGPIEAEGSYDIPLQPARPFLMLEYVSKKSERKDYDDNMVRYEHELQVPYYLLFHPDGQELTLYHHDGSKYVSVKPNEQGRLAIPELELEAAMLDGWVRFWFRGELLPLPADLLRDLQAVQKELSEARRRADEERRGRLAAEEELARLRLELQRLQGKS
jgi:Uma2 family endonuclease